MSFRRFSGSGPVLSCFRSFPGRKRFRKSKWLFAYANASIYSSWPEGPLLLLSGLGMGFFNPYLWQQFWYTASLVLFIIALSMGPLVLSPLTKPIQQLLAEHDGEDIPEAYEKLARKLFFYERVTNVIFLVIIFL